MKSIKEAFESKDKKVLANLATALVLGIILLVCSNSFFKDNSEEKETKIVAEVKENKNLDEERLEYENLLEKRLSEILSTVNGVGKVEVMITLANGREIVIAEDTVITESRTTESDSQGGQREYLEKEDKSNKILITGRDGYQKPLILKEVEPQIEGVIISAQGGDDVFVKSELIKAAQTVLGIEVHKVQVLKMK